MATTSAAEQLTSTLLEQAFSPIDQKEALLAEYRLLAEAYVNMDHSMAVLSDFQEDKSYLYVGKFGEVFGLPCGSDVIDSAFEECIFRKIHPDDLTERHILELSYFEYLKHLPSESRRHYSTSSRIRALNVSEEYSYVNHRTIYLKSLPNHSIWLALCTYAPSTDLLPRNGIDGKIVNNQTGELIPFESYKHYGHKILSRRETEVLALVAQGLGSKQIADQLNIAVYTVRRHRQNIIGKMRVSNATEAVKTAMLMGIILP